MRVKTDARRQAIVATAWEAFRENGFERTSMKGISDRLGGSKATLYGYFQSKEQLFAAALEQMIGESAEKAFSRLAGEAEFGTRLLDFANTYLEVRLTAEAMAIERALIAGGDRSDFGERLRQQFIQPHWRRLAAIVDQEMQAGRLRRADPMIATWQFRGMIEVDLVERRLHGDQTVTAHEVERAASEGVQAFLRAYAP
ncbi:MAG: TetR/AcrR family transcriptional regulator [Caulobacteraceae bacterium]|nr:TetR/AcrR family transcriptional regulator [Caulobacteraceae bacterium]